jgi:serine protease
MKHRSLISLLILALLFSAVPAFALDQATRHVGPVLTWNAANLARFSPEWVEVKFVEGSNVRIENGAFADDSGLRLDGLTHALAAEAVTELHPMLSHDRATLREWKRIAEIQSGVTGPDLSLWFDIRVAGGSPAVARLVNELNALPEVEIAHPVAIPEVASITGEQLLPSPDFTSRQGYLNSPPSGMNAPAAWAYTGGKGAGEHFIDVELCWTLDHEDFNYSKLFYVGPAAMDPSYETHGTAVLGEILGQHNTYGVNGFAPDVNYGVVPILIGEWPNVPHRFQDAIDHLSAGDVWLIELQMYPPGKSATPMEYVQANYDVIWTGVWARGIVCIEAGANGSQNLDDPSWGGLFDRNIRDSGAIMVAAGTPTGLNAESFTNYGSRMDVHGWGSTITTTGYGDLYNGGTLQTRYTAGFSGTSGASPMITGCALDLEGIGRVYVGHPINPITLRTILHNTGTPHVGSWYIGPRPNLGAAIPEVLALADAPEDAVAEANWRAIAYPNPVRAGSEIRFHIPQSGAARVAIFDPAGRLVRTTAGKSWDGRDALGREVAPGVYFVRLDGRGETTRIVLTR